ncbi:hypothetical protein Celaphus_00014551 [Cervus elaphus hippelaphus]|uniref:Uncharacterized protein n=1 Tax=Cervus elaphus hippelaphus TaxID=46360 RepID=A0A212D4T2_CEREH|nr:hypothetical protein Celaphus_00014551 [Cervus elaphus hippelaphus]
MILLGSSISSRLMYHLYFKMGDPNSRKKQALNRLRAQLRKKKESLADQFDFKMYIAFVFKEKKKKSALFEVSEVIPVMTNNYEENILKGVRDSSYSLESSIELLQKDVVQLHAPRYQSMRRDVIGCTQEMDFILWPRNDIEKIVCLLFSRWKESDEPFRPVQIIVDRSPAPRPHLRPSLGRAGEPRSSQKNKDTKGQQPSRPEERSRSAVERTRRNCPSPRQLAH